MQYQEETVTAKPWYMSATIWFNALAGVGVLVDWVVLQDFAFVENPIFAAIVTAVNLALRFKTNRPVASTEKTVILENLKG